MASITLQVNNSVANGGGVLSPSLFQYGTRYNTGTPYTWVDTSEVTGLIAGLVYWAIRDKSNINYIVSQGSKVITENNALPFEGQFTGTVISIPQSQHLKAKVGGVIVKDSNNILLLNTPQLLSDETVVIYLEESQTVTVRIS